MTTSTMKKSNPLNTYGLKFKNFAIPEEQYKRSNHGIHVLLKERPSKIKPLIPTIEELIYEIYDTQREIVNSMKPMQSKVFSSVGIAAIVKMCSKYEHVYFDGVLKSHASNHFYKSALKQGITDTEIAPYICSKSIEIFLPHVFGNQPIIRYEDHNGMKFMTISTNSSYLNMLKSRSILNSLSFTINKKYNCNLHLNREAYRVALQNGLLNTHPPQRHLFNEAAQAYINPQTMGLEDFVRAQVIETRHMSDADIYHLLNESDETTVIGYELKMATGIYWGFIKNFFGWMGNHPDLVKR